MNYLIEFNPSLLDIECIVFTRINLIEEQDQLVPDAISLLSTSHVLNKINNYSSSTFIDEAKFNAPEFVRSVLQIVGDFIRDYPIGTGLTGGTRCQGPIDY